MNIDKFKHQHVDILASVGALRTLVKDGIAENADRICKQIISMSALIKLHLAVENSVLYPALQSTNNAAVAHMGRQFQNEMESISAAYLNFARRWNSAASLSRDPETFRSDANTVLKVLHARMQQENTVFYPAIEAL